MSDTANTRSHPFAASGAVIRQARINKGLTIAGAAATLGGSATAWSRVETGVAKPSPAMEARIAVLMRELSVTEQADIDMDDPVKLHKIIRAIMRQQSLTDYVQDFIVKDPELEEYARQLDFYLADDTTAGAFK